MFEFGRRLEVGRRSGSTPRLGRVVGASMQNAKARPLGLALAGSAMVPRGMGYRALRLYAESASTRFDPSALAGEAPTPPPGELGSRGRRRQSWAQAEGGEDSRAIARLDALLDDAAVFVRPGSIVHAGPSPLSLPGAECPARGGAHGSRRCPRSASRALSSLTATTTR